MISTPTEKEVREALETIATSYSYDPPERWLSAHMMLRELRLTLQQQLKPYLWIQNVGLVLSFAPLVGGIWLMMHSLQDATFRYAEYIIGLAAVTALPGAIAQGGAWLARTIAARRHPLVRLSDSVAGAAERFENRYVEAASKRRSLRAAL